MVGHGENLHCHWYTLELLDHLKHTVISYFSDMGCGWGPAVLSSLSQIGDIRIAVNGSINDPGYWVGGSTDVESGNEVLYFGYYDKTRSGDHYILHKFCETS